MFARALTIALAVWFAGCEKPTHENIDKWLGTSKGPGKLKKALGDGGLDPDVSAHAGVNLLKKQKDADFRTTLEALAPARRTQVIEKLAPRLWDLARIEDSALLPNADQIAGKDALVTIRKWADEAQRPRIDGYLIDWYAVVSYEARAKAGIAGATVIRLIGPPAAKKLISVLNGMLAAPGQETTKIKIHDELLLALAVSGSPEAVQRVLEVAQLDRGDKTLTQRALNQLHAAYVDAHDQFDLVPPDGLVPNLPLIAALAKDARQAGGVVNTAIALIRAVGGQRCVDQIVPLIPVAHSEAKFKYVAGTFALRCGGPKAIAPVLRAMPDPGAYEQEELPGTLLLEISKMPRDQAQAALRPLVDERSTVVTWLAIEALAAIKSVEDAPRIAALAKRSERLTGFWGETGKPDPTLGQRARELADQLASR
ncbi:MAG TPA: hypothetical protein VN253_25340 [Kofleriaceae bacterium]|nr:hypothetical protein [Kofleriaceae bacterium]